MAYGQQISKEKVITATEKGKRIGSNFDDSNNAITNSKSIQDNNGKRNNLWDINSNDNDIDNIDKVIILTFGDTEKSQFTTAEPILDQYGFKAICRYQPEPSAAENELEGHTGITGRWTRYRL